MSELHLIVGLGNPGRQYEQTRHNAGWLVVDELARRWRVSVDRSRFTALCGEATPDDGRAASTGSSRVLLLKPLTYMNLSGRSVIEALQWHKLPISRLLVISDDLDLPPGRIRVRAAGSSGGQKGLAHITQVLGTDAFARVRVGIGKPRHPGQDTISHVLGVPEPDESPAFEQGVRLAADAAQVWLTGGIEAAMNRFNASPEPRKPQAASALAAGPKANANWPPATPRPKPGSPRPSASLNSPAADLPPPGAGTGPPQAASEAPTKG